MAEEISPWLSASRETVVGYRKMIDATLAQLSDEEFSTRPAPGINSVAVIIRHLAGNLKSRWTDFLTTDGEKPDRQREQEFLDWDGDRAALMKQFDEGWLRLSEALDDIDDAKLSATIFIRGESHSLPQAIMRSLTHLTYHVGQIALISRMVHHGEWRWLTIPPGGSKEHNDRTWGTRASRSIFKSTDETTDETP